MITILLTILKVLGILLLVLFIVLVFLVLLVLFVPVRYRISLHRKEGEEAPVAVEVKITWLLHLINAAFSYPEAAFVRVRIFCFTLFRSDKKKKESDAEPKQKTDRQKAPASNKEEPPSTKEEDKEEQAASSSTDSGEGSKAESPAESAQEATTAQDEGELEKVQEQEEEKNIFEKIKEFFQKLFSLFQNIQYTITQICDKIKHIVNNIQYYLNILKSDTFSRVWTLCFGEVFYLLKSILPGKISGSLLIGTGDPASTGQVLAVYGILYPMLGNHITVTPDFERQIVEGELFLRGKITAFKGLKVAWRVYFNRDVRRLIRLFKREAA